MSKFTPTSTAWRAQRKRVLQRDGYQCAYCCKPLEGEDATVDHVNPIALDPTHTYRDDELVSACRSCNSTKGTRATLRVPYLNPRWFK